MHNSVSLEITLKYISPDQLHVHMRREASPLFNLMVESALVPFTLAGIREHAHDNQAYGNALAKLLFSSPALCNLFNGARTAAKSLDRVLRLRLVIDDQCPVLSRVHWERLSGPDTDDSLALNSEVLLTRVVPDAGAKLRPMGPDPMRALIAIASPADLGTTWNAPALNQVLETSVVRGALAPIDCDVLGPPVSCESLAAAFEQDYDIVYLVCHGRADESDVRLLLDNPDARVHEAVPVPPADLISALSADTLPRLVLIGSCSSAAYPGGRPDTVVPAALGPLLVRAGVPVVVGMNGEVSIETAGRFFELLLRRLRRHGDIDRAASEARRGTLRRHDWSAPVVFSSLPEGDLRWPTGPATAAPGKFERWDELVAALRAGLCVPVVGPALLEPTVGRLTDVAAGLAKKHQFPLTGHRAKSLHQVSRFLETSHKRQGMLDRYGADIRALMLGDESGPLLTSEDITKWATSQDDPSIRAYRALAATRSSVFLTTDPFDTLAVVLRAAGAQPVVEHARWRRGLHLPEPIWFQEDLAPTPERPLVYHLFGRWDIPESLVVTDDDIVEYLLMASSGNGIFPEPLRVLIRDKHLLFLGFTSEDEAFRAVHRSIMSWMPARRVTESPTHIAAHPAPDASWALTEKLNDAKEYLMTYFDRQDLGIHWVPGGKFLDELTTKMRAPRND